MQPRGQLWFQLEATCRDFKDFSGLPEREALEILVIVLGNMLGEQKAALEQLRARQEPPLPAGLTSPPSATPQSGCCGSSGPSSDRAPGG